VAAAVWAGAAGAGAGALEWVMRAMAIAEALTTIAAMTMATGSDQRPRAWCGA